MYFHATPAELAAVGTDYVLNEANGTRGVAVDVGTAGAALEPRRLLLATTEQLCWYR